MSIFGGQTGKHRLASLTEDGRIAAVYPSEDQLWLYGPPINVLGDQGVPDPQGRPPVPVSDRDIVAHELWIDETLNGQTSNGAYGEEWVNLTIGGPAGYGNFNEQPYYTGHSQIQQSNPGAEQGWGVGPARRWAHYPFSELGNPARNSGAHLRMGEDPVLGLPQTAYYERSGIAWEMQWEPYKQRLPVNPVVEVPTTVPFTQNVPAYAGGQVQYPGIDTPVPLTDQLGYY